MSLIRTLILLDQGPTLLTSFHLNYLHKGPFSKYSYIGGESFDQYEFQEGHKHSVHKTVFQSYFKTKRKKNISMPLPHC